MLFVIAAVSKRGPSQSGQGKEEAMMSVSLCKLGSAATELNRVRNSTSYSVLVHKRWRKYRGQLLLVYLFDCMASATLELYRI